MFLDDYDWIKPKMKIDVLQENGIFSVKTVKGLSTIEDTRYLLLTSGQKIKFSELDKYCARVHVDCEQKFNNSLTKLKRGQFAKTELGLSDMVI